jgi:hypothetical protein
MDSDHIRDIVSRWWLSFILLPVCIYILVTRGDYLLIDHFNLLIHEGGHGLFMFFGRFVHIAGGTIMQIVLPLLIIWYFFRTGYLPGIQIFAVWLGQNFINISVYAADAQARRIPLLGGRGVIHDWHYMLGKTGMLEYDYLVGYVFVMLAVLTFVAALLMPAYLHRIR